MHINLVTYLSLAAICLSLIYRLLHKWKNRRFYELLGKMNSLPGYPILGNIHLIIGPRNEIVANLLNLVRKTETPLVFWAGTIPAVAVSKLEDIQEVTAKCSHREVLSFAEDTFLNGIISQKYDQWRKTRRLLNPAFSTFLMKQYLMVFNEQIQITCDLLKFKADTGEPFDAWNYMVNASIDMTTENIMGVKPNTQLNSNSEYSRALIKIMEFTIERIVSPWLHPRFMFNLYMSWTGQRRLVKVLHDFAHNAVINAKQKYELKNQQLLKNNNVQRKKSLSVPEREPRTMAEILLTTEGTDPSMTEKQIQAEFIHIISAGSESTAITMSFLLVMLGIHQDIQEKAYREVKTVMENRPTVTIEDLNELTFVDQCIKETMRVFTVLPATIRYTNEELTISNNVIIPNNCMVAIVLIAVHENPEYYPNPKQWNPDNFSPEAIAKRPKNSFVGFSLGARACLGSKYAMYSLKTQITYLLRNFHIRTTRKYEDVATTFDIMQRSKNGYPIILNTRE